MICIPEGPTLCIWNSTKNDYDRHREYYFSDTICQEMPYIYAMIPKTGGNSLENELLRRKIPTFGHVYTRYYPEKYRHKIKLMVRNPYDRAVSAYFFMKKGGFNNNSQYLQLVGVYETFEDWVLYGLKEKYTHWSSKYYAMEPTICQVEWLLDNQGQEIVNPDNIGRFEDYANEIKRLLGFDVSLHLNKTDHSHWSYYYKNPEVANRIYTLYRKDFELLGYSKDIPE